MRLSFYSGLAIAVLAADAAEASSTKLYNLAQIDEEDDSLAQTDNQSKVNTSAISENSALATAETDSNLESDAWTDIEGDSESEGQSEGEGESLSENESEAEAEGESESDLDSDSEGELLA